MNRVLTSILGALAVLAGLVVAVALVGKPVTWPHIALVCALVGGGAHFISNSLGRELLGGALDVLKAVRGGTPPAP